MEWNALADKLVAIVGRENVLSDECDLISYSCDHLPTNPQEKFIHKPDFVVKPKTTQHILEIIQLANHLKFPVVPRSAGTGITGGVIPLKGGVVLDMMSMNRILEIDERNMVVEVEACIGLETLEEELAKHGFKLGHMPCSRHAATVGGAISTSGIGYLCDRYGMMAEMVQGLEVVLPYGEVIQVGGKCGKSSCGYNLKQLFAGALGTLGVVTKATLSIKPLPEFSAMCAIGFRSFTRALDASYNIVRRGLRPAFNHVCDEAYVKCWGESMEDSSIRESLKALAAILYLRFEGVKEEEVRIQEDEALKICKAEGGIELDSKVAQIRWNNLLKGFSMTTEDSTFWTADIGVPFSKVDEVHDSVRKVIRKYNLRFLGARTSSIKNDLPFSFLFDKNDLQEWDNFRKAEEEIATIAINAGGTISVAQGVGNRPIKHLMRKELGPALDAMKKIKRALDPNDIMNPGLI